MSKHTPGPWRHQYVGEINFRAPESDDFCIVADDLTCTAISWGGQWDKGDANARLIAAAPELLEALRPFAGLDLRPGGFNKHDDSQPVYARDKSVITVGDIRQAAAAIAKATGEQP